MVCVDKLPVRVNNDVESMADFSPFSETPTSGGDDTDGVADDVLSILWLECSDVSATMEIITTS